MSGFSPRYLTRGRFQAERGQPRWQGRRGYEEDTIGAERLFEQKKNNRHACTNDRGQNEVERLDGGI